jgi:hypothetical protein
MNFNLINTPAVLETAIPASERPQYHAFDRVVTGIGFTLLTFVCLYHTLKKSLISALNKG